jgi:hypothetical protein
MVEIKSGKHAGKTTEQLVPKLPESRMALHSTTTSKRSAPSHSSRHARSGVRQAGDACVCLPPSAERSPLVVRQLRPVWHRRQQREAVHGPHVQQRIVPCEQRLWRKPAGQEDHRQGARRGQGPAEARCLKQAGEFLAWRDIAAGPERCSWMKHPRAVVKRQAAGRMVGGQHEAGRSADRRGRRGCTWPPAPPASGSLPAVKPSGAMWRRSSWRPGSRRLELDPEPGRSARRTRERRPPRRHRMMATSVDTAPPTYPHGQGLTTLLAGAAW